MPSASARQVHHARGIGAGQHVKRAGDEIIQGQKECLHARKHDAHVRHQLRMLLAIQEQREENVDRKQQAPQQQRAFLSRPQSGEFVIKRQGAVAVRGHIGHRKIVGEEEIFKRGDGKGDQSEHRHAGVARALRQQSAARNDPRDPGDEGINGSQESEQQCERTENIQTDSPWGY